MKQIASAAVLAVTLGSLYAADWTVGPLSGLESHFPSVGLSRFTGF